MAQACQVVHGLPCADRVVVADHVDETVGDVTTDLDNGHLLGQRLEVASVQVGPDDDQSGAAVAQELIDDRILATAGGERAEQQVVAQLLGDGVHVLNQLDFEGPAHREQNAQGTAAVSAQPLGERVGAVTELGSSFEHPLSRRCGRALSAAEHDRHQSLRHPHMVGDVSHRQALLAPGGPGAHLAG